MKKGQRVATAWINSPLAAEVAAFYTSGHSVKETAEQFGITEGQVNNLARRRGLTNGKDFREARSEYQLRDTEEKLSKLLSEKWFEYVGGFSGKESKVKIRCCACGTDFDRSYDYVRRKNPVCPTCERNRKDQEKAEHEAQKKRCAEQKALQREIEKQFNPTIGHYERQRLDYLNKVGTCEICGKRYTVMDYVFSCGLKYARDSGVCSQKCRDEKSRIIRRLLHKNRRDNHRHRAKKYGCEYDSSVTLKRLIARDGLQCAICGKQCNPNDNRWTKYSGPLSPSIDHIIPMSKGGGHVWGNVQIAHIICNSEKGDKFEGVDA